MVPEYHIDYETFSCCDLKKLGQYRYASDPTTEIILCAVCCGDGTVLLWDRYATDEENAPALGLLQDISMDEEAIVWAHNSPFEIAISKYLWSKTFKCLPPKVTQWRCTAALCRVAAIPSSLAGAAEFLALGDQKDPIGKALIKVFSVPHKTKKLGSHKRIPVDDPKAKATVAGVKTQLREAWTMFRGYCIKDVIVERAVGKRLTPLNLTGMPLQAFLSDLQMNDRGIPIDTDAVGKAETMIDAYNETIGQKFQELTGLNHTQRDKVFAWLQTQGYPAADLRATTMAVILDMDGLEDDEEEAGSEEAEAPEYDVSNMTPEAFEALRYRALLSFAAVKKLKTMRLAACPDGYVRGALMWHGAMRTGRSSSKTVQVHNFRRPSINSEEYAKCNGEPESHTVYRMIKDGSGSMETFEDVFGPPLESVASAIRHFICPKDGQKFLDIDLAQIEARVLAWLSGHGALLDSFRKGLDLYKVAASLMFGTEYGKVTKDERFMGKISFLACGYQGGVEAFLSMAKIYGVVVEKELAAGIVKAYREGNKPVTSLWKAMQQAAVEAITTPGVWVPVSHNIKFGVSSKLGYPSLNMMLPSGRVTQYPYPEVKLAYKVRHQTGPDEFSWVNIPEWRAKDSNGDKLDGVWVTNEISYYGQMKQSNQWGRIKTHGGSLVENCLGADTEVLTEDGWFTITDVGTRRVFDGAGFVKHSGLRSVRKNTTMLLGSIEITPEHLVLGTNGWNEASKTNLIDAYGCCDKLLREAFREPCGDHQRGGEASGETPLECRLRLRRDHEAGLQRHGEGRHVLFQAVPTIQSPHIEATNHSRDVEAPGIPCVEEHAGPVPAACAPVVAQLRGERDQSLCEVAKVRELLVGHGAEIRQRGGPGSGEQRARVLAGELPMGDQKGKREEQEELGHGGHSMGEAELGRGCRAVGNRLHDVALPSESRGQRPQKAVHETQLQSCVYDLIGCGPRRRFVVRGKDKKPIVVHNCCQAVAGDFLTHGILNSEKAGYQPVFSVHDQGIFEYHPSRNTVEGLVEAFTRVPEWAPRFPLGAEAAVTDFYTK